jgi:hypothetical protein
MGVSMFKINFRGDEYVTSKTLQQLVDGMGKIIGDELRARDAEIKKLRDDFDTDRRLRLGMKYR